jgi:hypothetical protein
MRDAILSFANLLLGLVGATGVTTGSLAVGAIIVTAALVVAVVCFVATPSAARAALRRPRRSIDVSALLAQSDPDAAGHPRSRAPGFAASAA